MAEKTISGLAKKNGKTSTKKVQKSPLKPKFKTSAKTSDSSLKLLSKDLVLLMHKHMVKARVLEERLIKIYKAGDGYFWIGGPGEEAWAVPLGLCAEKGHGKAHDYFHLHYRGTPTLVALGLEMVDATRLMMNRATDPSTGGRNFAGHYCFPQWNVVPATSPIETQYIMALGTAHVQKRYWRKDGKNPLTIVTGGDAGTAEGDFASCLVWASRKGKELPLLITVQNNQWGISTAFEGQHGETQIADRARAFNIRARVVNGNDPIESYLAIQEEMNYIRKTGKPSFIEAKLSRLYGHSSASGANFVTQELDCIRDFEKKLLDAGYLTSQQIKNIWNGFEEEGLEAQKVAKLEPGPAPETIWENIYVGSENANWRKF
jgi:2-oxoisovalerate dehydrogenase E1 component alpha subunit